jgi:TRAP transporter TAXI family solute receptor
MIKRLPFLRYLLWVFLILLVIVGLYWLYVAVVLRTPTEFTMATGREGGGYYFYGTEYANELEEFGVTLHIQPTAGSIAILDLLNAGEVEVGLVQGGTAADRANDSLYALGSVFYEPIWVFYRRAGFTEPLEYLYELEGRRVAIGEVDSGTNVMARSMLALNEVTAENATFVETPNAEALTMLERGEVDAAFFVMAPASEMLAQLLQNEEIALMDFRRAKAYATRFPHLSEFVIGEGAIDFRRNIPKTDTTIVATTAMLVANQELHPDSARQLLTAAIAVNGRGGPFQEEGEFPSTALTELPIPSSAATFLEVGPTGLERFVPVPVAALIERLLIFVLPLAVLLFPLMRGAPVAYRFANQYRVYRWYTRMRQIERQLEGFDLDEVEEQIDYLTELEQRLADTMRVPIFYQRDFYDLRMHIRLVLERLILQRDLLQSGERPHDVAEATKQRVAVEADAIYAPDDRRQRSVL